MAIRGTSTHTSTGDTVYANIEAWKAANGNVGIYNPNLTSSELTLGEDGQTVTRVLVWENDAARIAWKASLTPTSDKSYTSVNGALENI